MATTTKGYPYPLGTDRLMDGDNVIQALAEAVDDSLGKALAGKAAVNAATAGTIASLAVTFPVGYFTAAPVVVVNHLQNNPFTVLAGAFNIAATGFTCYALRTGSTGVVTVCYYAVQGVS